MDGMYFKTWLEIQRSVCIPYGWIARSCGIVEQAVVQKVARININSIQTIIPIDPNFLCKLEILKSTTMIQNKYFWDPL